MAPNRKKKNPASNPARGFATTSTVSKSKLFDNILSVDKPEEAIEPSHIEVRPQKPIEPHQREKELHELSPDELEHQLVESELQLLVEKHGEKCKKDASRHASRLRTERRLLRSQATPLSTGRWLPEGLLQVIYDSIDASFCESVNDTSQKRDGLSLDDLCIRLWTLRRTLIEMGFLQNRVDEALKFLIQNQQMIERTNAISSREGIWGIDECLDWLALSCTAEEMPDYETHKTQARERILRQSANSLAISGWDTPDISTSPSGVATPTEASSTQDNSALREAEKPEEDAEAVSGGDSSDDELEPQYRLSRYLELKTRLHKRRPDLTEAGVRAAKAARNKAGATLQTGNNIDLRTRGLLNRLRKFESDILFDRDEADEQWLTRRIELIKEAAARKKLGIADQPANSTDNTLRIANENPKSADSSHGAESVNADDATVDLAEFFAALPESKVDNETGRRGIISTTIDGNTVEVRTFGKWPGIGPRRIFEEACRARDSSSKVSYTLISSSSFSYRHSITVRWSRTQEIPFALDISGFLCQYDGRNFKIDMLNMSSPDSVQSEAFASTVALFLIFAGSPKEEKAHLRLPAAFKFLWDEMAEQRKSTIAAEDCGELREIRHVVEESNEKYVAHAVPVSKPRNLTIESEPLGLFEGVPHSELDTVNPQALAELWLSRASSPAYINMLKSRITLPIWNFKSELLTAIEECQVVIICGETGCGKSTQVPAYILESELSNGRHCKIYCTEPRRISAISLARRVSEELGERKTDVGTTRSLVGYAIRLESHITPQTRLVYATTGIVMRMLEGGDDLQEITHLVLDEVHERTIDSDFLLIVLRKLMARRPSLKVILMSATVNAEQFSAYMDGALVLNIPGRTFPVQTKYLEDAIEVTSYSKGRSSTGTFHNDEEDDDTNESSSKLTSKPDLAGYSPKTLDTLSQLDEYRIDYELIIRLLETIARNSIYAEYSKAILVFLPGIAEIRRLNDMLAGHPAFSRGWYVYPLHSTIATEDQEKAFLVPPNGIRKVVLATNIAETGITIPDVTCVVDTGKHKEMRFDERRQLSRLIESFISRANAKQRRGRAGRVQNGLCFHLYTKERHDKLMADQQTPEMLRLSLQDLVLRVKICKLGSIEQVLGEALDAPLPKNVRRAIDSLIDIKALTPAEELTPLGRQLAKLPLDVFLGKLILLGSLFGCLDATLSIAAILSSKSPFSAPMGARSQADLARLSYKKGDSDLLTVYNAYCAWRRVCLSTGSSEYQFCRKNFLSPQTLSNIEDLKAQLTTVLVDAGFLLLDEARKAALNRARVYSRQRNFVELPPGYDVNVNNNIIINSVIAWSFYPKLLMRDGKGWRNVANNQSVSLYPTSVNKGVSNPPKWLSFYHIMQSSNKSYNAHETSAVEDFAIALVCGDVDFKMYSGVIVIDGNRLRFSVMDWKVLLVIKRLRTRLHDIIAQFYRTPAKPLSVQQQKWLDIWQKMFSQEWILKDK